MTVSKLDLHDTFNAADVLQAIQGKVLAQASVMGIYTLNTALAPTQIGALSAT